MRLRSRGGVEHRLTDLGRKLRLLTGMVGVSLFLTFIVLMKVL